MQKVKVIQTNDLANVDLRKVFKASNSLCITATRSMRFASKKVEGLTICDFTEIQQIINVETKNSNCLRESEERYILFKAIEEVDNESIKQSLHNSSSGLYELYSALLLGEVNPKQINLEKMKETQTNSTIKIFELYKNFYKKIQEQKTASYQETLRQSIKKYIEKYDEIALSGFAFFNDLQAATFYEILKAKKLIAVIIGNEEILMNKWLAPVLKNNNIEYEVFDENNPDITKFDELRLGLFNTKSLNKDLEQSIKIVEPFPNREEEFKYIVNCIVSRLKHLTTRELIAKEIEKIAIALTYNFSKNSHIFNEILKTKGIFISDDDKIYTDRNEYLNDETIKQSYQNKIKAFNNFVRLELYQSPKTLFRTQIGKFICEIYKIADKGMNAESFNTLISTSWLFADKEESNIISEFSLIKEFFATRQKTEEWVKQIDNITKIKSKIKKDKTYNAHPLMAVKESSLDYFNKYIIFIHHIITNIQKTNGNVKQHIKSLIDAIRTGGSYKSMEQELLANFSCIINSDERGVNIEHDYFAKNFQTLISEYMSMQDVMSKNIRLNTINLETVNQYDIVYLPMFEVDKYPYAINYEFPFTKIIMSALENKEFVQGYDVPMNKNFAYNNTLSKITFQNLFKIATEEIVFTRTGYENGSPITLSVYGEDIISKTKIKQKSIKIAINDEKSISDLIFKKANPVVMSVNELLMKDVCPKLFYYLMNNPGKVSYKDKFLLNFYARAVIFNKFFTTMADGQEYTVQRLQDNVNEVLSRVCDEVFDTIPLFDINNKYDLKITARKQIIGFIERIFVDGKFTPKDKFLLSLGQEQNITHGNVTVYTHKNLVVKDVETKTIKEFDITKSLDFLTTSSKGFKSDKKHFDELIEELRINPRKLDRASILNFLSFKVNTQLSTNFKVDGIERVNRLVDDLRDCEYSNYGLRPSGFCAYCRLKDICMGGVDDE